MARAGRKNQQHRTLFMVGVLGAIAGLAWYVWKGRTQAAGDDPTHRAAVTDYLAQLTGGATASGAGRGENNIHMGAPVGVDPARYTLGWQNPGAGIGVPDRETAYQTGGFVRSPVPPGLRDTLGAITRPTIPREVVVGVPTVPDRDTAYGGPVGRVVPLTA